MVTTTTNHLFSGPTAASRSNHTEHLTKKENFPFDTLYGNINGTNVFTPIHPSTVSNSHSHRGYRDFSKYSSMSSLLNRNKLGGPTSQNRYNLQKQNSPSPNIKYPTTTASYRGMYGNLPRQKIQQKIGMNFKFLDYFTFTSYTTMTLIILSITIHTLNYFFPFFHLTDDYFTTHTKVAMKQWGFLELFQMFSYILGHSDWDHLWGNTSQILILGNIIEEKFGSKKLAKMILITALTGSCSTFLVNAFNIHIRGLNYGYAVRGASGIVYSFWVLASVVGNKSGKIPLELLIVLSIILTSSAINFYWNPSTNISHMGHVIGGITGGLLGLIYSKKLS